MSKQHFKVTVNWPKTLRRGSVPIQRVFLVYAIGPEHAEALVRGQWTGKQAGADPHTVMVETDDRRSLWELR